VPVEKAVNGKTGFVRLGINLNFIQEQAAPSQNIGVKNIFSYTNFPISATGIIFILIIWNILWYNFFIRRSMK